METVTRELGERSSGRMTVVERKTVTIATLGPMVRLVVVQFMMPKDRVPASIPAKRASAAPPLPQVSGVETLPSTKDLNLHPFIGGVIGYYELVDAWYHPAKNSMMSVVRFVLCLKDYVRRDELFPDFVDKRIELSEALFRFVEESLWTVQGYLNPYLEPDGSRTGQEVLMLGCVARKQTVEPFLVNPRPFNEVVAGSAHDWKPRYENAPVMVFEGGRDPLTRQGIGRKVRLSDVASKLNLTYDSEVQLELR